MEVKQDDGRAQSHNAAGVHRAIRALHPWELQVHSKESCDDHQRQSYGAVDGEHFHDFVGAVGHGGKVDIERAGKQVPVRLDELDGAHQVIVDIAKIRIEIIAQQASFATNNGVHHLTNGSGNAAEFDQGAFQPEDARQHVGFRTLQYLGFDVGNLVGHVIQQRDIFVDDS